MRIRTLAFLLASCIGADLFAQVTARQGGPEEEGEPTVTEVPSPMVLDLVVPAWTEGKRDRKLNWSTSETAKFACDKAQVRRVTVTRVPKPDRKAPGPSRKWTKGAAMELDITVALATDWTRQDIDLTVTLTDSAGQQVVKKTWDDLTIGKDGAAKAWGAVWASSSKTVTLVASLSAEQVERFEQEPLNLKIVVDIQDDEDED